MSENTDPRPVGRPRKLTPDALERARTLYESGKSCADIAKLVWCKVSAQTLYYHLSGRSPVGDGQVDMRPRGRKGLSLAELSLVCNLYRDGMPVSGIRVALARREARERRIAVEKVPMFAAKTISDALKEAGIKVRRGRPAKPESAESAE